MLHPLYGCRTAQPAFGGLKTSIIGALQSGRPFNITTGVDNHGDGHLKNRPARVSRAAG